MTKLSTKVIDVISAETHTCEEFCAKFDEEVAHIHSRTQERIRKREIKQRQRHTYLAFTCKIA
jgi:hypothetical protein